MYSLFKQTYPATGVEHAIQCRFFGSREKNLVVAGANVLRVFHMIPSEQDPPAALSKKETVPKMKLECLATYHLHGVVMSMASASLPGSSRDIILLSFAHAKLSLIEYDPVADNVKTLSLHNFEDEGIGRPHKIPEIRVDPEGRCAAVLIFRNTLAILPFRKEVAAAASSSSSSATLAGDAAASGNVTLSSYIIRLNELDEERVIDNVVDVQFLHGYYEPTLCCLYEPVGTFPGRIAVRSDTCNMVAVSLNTQQRVHPVIWSLNGLPFDCRQLLPVPKPLGGALIVAVNSIVYVNQSVPPYGVAVNSIADHSTSFPLKIQEGSRIALDCARAAFLQHDRVVLSLKGGELYVLTLFADSMRSVRKFSLEKAAASVLTTCLCICDQYLFLGSRLGNSLLLAFHSKDGHGHHGHHGHSPMKKPKMERFSLAFDQELDHLDEEEIDQYLYGEDHDASESKAANYQFEVCDSLLNIGPCGQMAVGEPASTCEEFTKSRADPDLEIVTTSGYGKNGALCVLQRTIKPQVVTTFELPDVTNMFSVYAAPVKPSAVAEDDSYHAFLLLTRADNTTTVLQTGQEINELEGSGFNHASPTILAANVGDNRFVVQVCPTNLRLVDATGATVDQLTIKDADFVVQSASVLDPHVALLSCDGRIGLVRLSPTNTLVFNLLPKSENGNALCLCLYRDVSGLFTTLAPAQAEPSTPVQPSTPKNSTIKKEVDDEDEYLYGDSDVVENHNMEDHHTLPPPNQRMHETNQNNLPPTDWLAVVRRNGSLEVHSVTAKGLQLNFMASNVHIGHRLLFSPRPEASGAASGSSGGIPCDIVEIGIFGLGHQKRRPLLIMRTIDFNVLIYEAVAYYGLADVNAHHLRLRFRKLTHNLLLKEKKM